MGDPKGFLKIKRQASKYRPACDRVKDYKEVAVLRPDSDSKEQAARCMDCGTPFCHWGCPVGNFIPEWNDLMFRGLWEKALELLAATNNFPEFTGRLCPGPCEYACVLGINDDPVTIRENELAIIEHGFEHDLIKPKPPKKRTGKHVAIVGSGPAGLAAADQLNKAGHKVTVFEKDEEIGGILRYGIPDFKIDKKILDRRIKILKKEGIEFKTSANVGIDKAVTDLIFGHCEEAKGRRSNPKFHAVLLTGGSRVPRDLKIEGRDLKGIYFAMDYLTQSNRCVGNGFKPFSTGGYGFISAKDKEVLVIGGGDTGADCVGTAHRQGAKKVVQIEVLPRPSECLPEGQPWPKYPMVFKTSSSHEEGGERHWAILTKKFTGDKDGVKKVLCVKVDFSAKDEKSCPVMREIPGSGFEIEAGLVLLAIGFAHPEHKGVLEQLKVEFDQRGNVKTDETHMTPIKGVFSAGDMRRGQSLIVWAISEGRRSARYIDKFLMGQSALPVV